MSDRAEPAFDLRLEALELRLAIAFDIGSVSAGKSRR
jgi:hypothetical protein